MVRVPSGFKIEDPTQSPGRIFSLESRRYAYHGILFSILNPLQVLESYFFFFLSMPIVYIRGECSPQNNHLETCHKISVNPKLSHNTRQFTAENTHIGWVLEGGYHIHFYIELICMYACKNMRANSKDQFTFR